MFVINGIGRFAYDPETDLNIMSRQESMMFTGSVNFETNKRLPSAFPNERVPLVDGKQFFNAVQLRRAKLCRKIHWVLNHPSDDVLKKLLDEGSICGCPLTGRDVTNMTKIFGPCKECLKGKTTSPHSQDVAFRRAIAEKPGEHIGIDVYFVTIISRMGKKVSIPFLLVSCYFSAYMHVLRLKSKTAGELWNRLNEVIQWYKGHGWEVKKVFSDRENVMGSIKRILHSCVPRIDMSRCGTDTHEKLVERYARVCRDKFRTVKASVWYPMPQYFLPHLLEDCARMNNILPNARLNHSKSPREIVEGLKLEFKAHIKAPFGTYAEFRVPHLRDLQANEERTATGIIVGRNLDETGTFKVWLLESEELVNRASILKELYPTAEARLRIASKTPRDEVAEADVFRPIDTLSRQSIVVPNDQLTVDRQTSRGDDASSA